ncbi:MAG: hypothetical protein AAGI11_08065 [Pseudomonadota bacterium]
MAAVEINTDLISGSDSGAAYRHIECLVASGAVELQVIISPPRTLSTLLGKVLAESSDIGCWCNEPTSKFGLGDQRVDASYRTVLDAISKARPSADGVRRVLLSVIASSVGPEKEIKDLLAVSEKVSFSIRNPVLAIESFIVMIAQILAEVGAAPGSKSQMIREAWVPPESNLDHLEDDDPDIWVSHMRHLQSQRDYRWVTDRQHYIANSIANTEAFRRELWASPGHVALVHSGDLALLEGQPSSGAVYRARVKAALNLDPDSLAEQAPDLHAIVAYTAASWLQTWRLFQATRQHAPEKLGGVVDATQLQLQPGPMLGHLRRRIGLGERPPGLGPLVATDGYGEQYAETELKAETMFGRAYASATVEGPEKPPIELWRLPAFVQRNLPLDMAIYMSLSAQLDCIPDIFGSLSGLLESPCQSAVDAELRLKDLDPVYAYSQAVLASAQGLPEGEMYCDQLRAEYPAHCPTFDLIDEAAPFVVTG